MRAQILADPAFEIRAGDCRANIDIAIDELKFDCVTRRQRDFGRRDRAVEREAEVELDQSDEVAQWRRIESGARQLPQFTEIGAALHEGELIPASEPGIVVVRQRQHFAERAVATSLAETRRDDAVDDAGVESISGDADAGMAERLGPQHTGRSRKADNGEVAGAAAEIGDQHSRVAVEVAGEREGRADRLVDVARVAGTEPAEGVTVALHRERVVRTWRRQNAPVGRW